jgi:hypothetical protein
MQRTASPTHLRLRGATPTTQLPPDIQPLLVPVRPDPCLRGALVGCFPPLPDPAVGGNFPEKFLRSHPGTELPTVEPN